LVEFLARREGKQQLKRLWHDITEIDYAEFVPEDKTDIYCWRTKKGTFTTRRWKRPETWENLLRDATLDTPRDLLILGPFKALLLPFLLVYPHRLTPAMARALEADISSNW
jgi:hypothetical protein